MALKPIDPATGKPKALDAMSGEEVSEWMRERLESIRKHECDCDRDLLDELLPVARKHAGPHEVEYLDRLVRKLDAQKEA